MLEITSEQIEPIINAILGNLDVIVPVGVAIFAVFTAVSLIPRVISKFIDF